MHGHTNVNEKSTTIFKKGPITDPVMNRINSVLDFTTETYFSIIFQSTSIPIRIYDKSGVCISLPRPHAW